LVLGLLTLVACEPTPGDTGEAWDEDRTVEVAPDDFLMGCDPAADPACEPDEQPQHTVTVSRFQVDRLEVQVGDYAGCVDAGACTAPALVQPDDPAFPVTGVDVVQASTFCAWGGKRLPTEAEWEMAARGTDARLYPWGDTPPDCSLVAMPGCGDRLQRAGNHVAGASPYGALDMAGNAWEWVSDYYANDYYAESPPGNPEGPDPTGLRVVRGTSHYADTSGLRASNREPAISGGSCPICGFRCVVDD
jgi:formylglycine-generating enzyme required for sulfatase activity